MRSAWLSWTWSLWRCQVFVRMVLEEREDDSGSVFHEQTGKLEDQSIMSVSTLEYMREKW